MALRRAQYAEIREIDRTIQLDSLAILEQVMRHFYWKARILEGMGTEGGYDAVDRAWAETGKWAKEVAQFRHPKIESIPNLKTSAERRQVTVMFSDLVGSTALGAPA